MKTETIKRPINECVRCATCCKKGGPALHVEDRKRIEDGTILLKYLYTIRQGELTYDNVKNCILPAAADIIKITSKKNFHCCTFLDESNNVCNIYENRPVECRVLKCWDTREIERIYAKNRLTRKDVLFKIKDIWNLVSDHEKRCSYTRITETLTFLLSQREAHILQELREMIRYDKHLRSVLAEKGGMDPELMDFLFGHPLRETIKRFQPQTAARLGL
jgi:Fe-S-cluster containining protein